MSEISNRRFQIEDFDPRIGARQSAISNRQLPVVRVDPPNQLDCVFHQVIEYRQSVSHTVRTSWQIHDQRFFSHAGETPSECSAMKGWVGRHPKRLGDARRFPLDNALRGFRGNVARAQPGTARREDQVGLVTIGPLCERRGDAIGLIGDKISGGYDKSPFLRPVSDCITRCVGPLPARTGIGDRENSDTNGHGGLAVER